MMRTDYDNQTHMTHMDVEIHTSNNKELFARIWLSAIAIEKMLKW